MSYLNSCYDHHVRFLKQSWIGSMFFLQTKIFEIQSKKLEKCTWPFGGRNILENMTLNWWCGCGWISWSYWYGAITRVQINCLELKLKSISRKFLNEPVKTGFDRLKRIFRNPCSNVDMPPFISSSMIMSAEHLSENIHYSLQFSWLSLIVVAVDRSSSLRSHCYNLFFFYKWCIFKKFSHFGDLYYRTDSMDFRINSKKWRIWGATRSLGIIQG